MIDFDFNLLLLLHLCLLESVGLHLHDDVFLNLFVLTRWEGVEDFVRDERSRKRDSITQAYPIHACIS